MASTCPRACVSNQHWRPVETPSTEVFNDHSPLRGSLPQENRPVREQPLLRLSKQNMTVETATQSAWTNLVSNLPSPACAVTTFFRFSAQLSAWRKRAGHDEMRSPTHFKCLEIMPAIFSMSTLRARDPSLRQSGILSILYQRNRGLPHSTSSAPRWGSTNRNRRNRENHR